MRIAINGFGRIGRMVLRAIFESRSKDFEVVAINDLGSIHSNAHLLKYDSIHGKFPGDVCIQDEKLLVNTKDYILAPITVFAEPKPELIPYDDIDIVFECSGRFTSKEAAQRHLRAGAKKVLISAPAEGVDLTVVYGVNHKLITKEHVVLSNGSCTTNCLAPIASVLEDNFGIESGYMTTIHAYTGDQRLVDSLHSDLRRARASAMSMIPTSTGAARALGLVLPSLQGKLDGSAIRVPTANVSLVDFKFTTRQSISVTQINEAMKQASKTSLHGVLSVVSEPLVSCDFNHNSYSSNFDLTQTQVIGANFGRVLSWYDNEWGFANRMLDVARCL